MSNENLDSRDGREAVLVAADKVKTGFRLTKEFLESEIAKGTVEYPEVVLENGSVARWCHIRLDCGFSVFSTKPSLVLSPERDIPEIGKKIVYENAFDQLYALYAFEHRRQCAAAE